MKRLTIRNSDGSVSQPSRCDYWAAALCRLAAYEDTGLEPEEIAEYKKFEDEVIRRGVTFKRIIDLVGAEWEGLLTVRPCTVGDTVWTNWGLSDWGFRDEDKPHYGKVISMAVDPKDKMDGSFIEVLFGKRDHIIRFCFSEIGKIVFLTREEAVAVLEKRGAENE